MRKKPYNSNINYSILLNLKHSFLLTMHTSHSKYAQKISIGSGIAFSYFSYLIGQVSGAHQNDKNHIVLSQCKNCIVLNAKNQNKTYTTSEEIVNKKSCSLIGQEDFQYFQEQRHSQRWGG